VIGAVFGDHTQMKRSTHPAVCAAVVSASLVLAACHRDQQQSSDGKPTSARKSPVAVKHGPTAAEQTAGMVEAAATGKSTMPVQLKFDLPQRPVVGQPLVVNIALISQIDADTAKVRLDDSSGLDVAAGGGDHVIGKIDPDFVYRQEIKLVPSADGVFFLNFTVTLRHDEIDDIRTFTVPIIVTANRPAAADGAH
jgi:hypothetical protein